MSTEQIDVDINLPSDPKVRQQLIAKLDEWGNAEARKKAEGSLQTQIIADIHEEFEIDKADAKVLAKWRRNDTFGKDSAKADARAEAFQTLFEPTEGTEQDKALQEANKAQTLKEAIGE